MLIESFMIRNLFPDLNEFKKKSIDIELCKTNTLIKQILKSASCNLDIIFGDINI